MSFLCSEASCLLSHSKLSSERTVTDRQVTCKDMQDHLPPPLGLASSAHTCTHCPAPAPASFLLLRPGWLPQWDTCTSQNLPPPDTIVAYVSTFSGLYVNVTFSMIFSLAALFKNCRALPSPHPRLHPPCRFFL